MKKKMIVALGVLIVLMVIGVIAVGAYRSSESYRAKKAAKETQFIGTPAVPEDAMVMQGKIVEIENGKMIVEPLIGSTELNTSDCMAFNYEGVKIGIDNITYVCTGIQMPIEPDESSIEYVEIPVEGNSDITAFARMQDSGESYLVCLIGSEWYKFIAE